MKRSGVRACRWAVAAGCVWGLIGAGAYATDWVEPRSNDAGRFPETALVPEGEVGPLESIFGQLNPMAPGRGPGMSPTDAQDLWAIWIDDPAAFSAQAVAAPGSMLNPQLYLFDAAGFGVLSNDDFSSADPYARLFPLSDDGTGAVTAPGLYYLGIAGTGSIPISGSASPIFSFATPTELSGPDGIGGGAALSEWIGPTSYGAYEVRLTGTRYLPAPGAASVAIMAAGAAASRRRRCSTVA